MCIFSGQCWQKALGLGAIGATTHDCSRTRMRLKRCLRGAYAESAVTLLDFCEVPDSRKHGRPLPNLFSHQMRTAKQQTQKSLRGTKRLRDLAHCSVFLTPPALMTRPLLITSKWVYGMAHMASPLIQSSRGRPCLHLNLAVPS